MKSINQIWKDIVRQYSNSKNPIPFNFKKVSMLLLQETRSDFATHYLHRYPAKMYPYIPLFLLGIEEICPPDGVVLDPFCGSGTVLLESLIHPLFPRITYGVEINPLGRLISQCKTTAHDEAKLEECLKKILSIYPTTRHMDLWIPNYDLLEFWFSEANIRRLSRLRYCIEHADFELDYKNFFWVCFSKLVRPLSKADPFIPPPVLLKINKYKNSPDKMAFLKTYLLTHRRSRVTSLFRDIANRNIERACKLRDIYAQRAVNNGMTAAVIWDDARQIKKSKVGEKGKIIDRENAPSLPDESIDLILTSPPYMAAQKYIRTNRLELLWLGSSSTDIRDLQKNIIGSESHSCIPDTEELGPKSVLNLVSRVGRKSNERAAIVGAYFKEMRRSIQEMYRVLNCGGYCIVVIGNNTVAGKRVNTQGLISEIASEIGFAIIARLKDRIRGRGMITARHFSGGLIENEYILVLRKE